MTNDQLIVIVALATCCLAPLCFGSGIAVAFLIGYLRHQKQTDNLDLTDTEKAEIAAIIAQGRAGKTNDPA